MSSLYPPLPPYYQLYKQYDEDESSAPPPPPPIEGEYVMYGAPYKAEDLLPSLEEQGVRQLYPKDPNVDVKKELRALCRELVLLMLELSDVVAERPSQYARRVEDIGLVFKNIHHLLNSLRPHQARATLIYILEMQLESRKQALAEIRKQRMEAQALLKASVAALQEEMDFADDEFGGKQDQLTLPLQSSDDTTKVVENILGQESIPDPGPVVDK